VHEHGNESFGSMKRNFLKRLASQREMCSIELLSSSSSGYLQADLNIPALKD
jgi:hypothetical protein